MAFVAGRRAKVLIGEFDLSAFLNNASAARTADLADVSVFGDTDREFLKTMQAATVTLSGFIDTVAGATEPVLSSFLTGTSTRPVSIFWDADAIGSPGICGAGWEGSYEDSAPVDGVQAIAANLSFTGQVDRAVSLHALGAETGTGAYASVDNGASSSNGAVAVLHVTAAGSSGTGTVAIQDSADNMTWTPPLTGGTFTNFTAATSEVIYISGTIRRYVRANLTSARNTQTFAVAFGRRP
jgi:hypothetical protein